MKRSLAAERMKEIPGSGIREVFNKALRLEAKGVKVINFGVGRPNFDTPRHIKEAAMEAMDKGMVHYTPNAGMPRLLEALTAHLKEYKGLAYDSKKEIMATGGGQEAMYLSLSAFLEPGDEILVPDPGYSQFTSCIRLAGGIPVPIPLLEEENFAPDLEVAGRLVTDRTRGIIVNSPQNPTGGVMTADQIREVCRFAKERDLVLFSDEAYDRILYDGAEFVSPAAMEEMKERTVIWGSLSKTYSMTGWRIGYLAAPADLVEAAVRVQQNILLSICSFAQAGAIAALEGPQECVEEMVEKFDERRKLVLDAISACPGLECTTTPKGAFYVFVRFDVPGMDCRKVADLLLEKGGVALVPGVTFGRRGEGYLRLSYATSFEECRIGMERITRVMKELLG
ncbi:MAG: pyridoxal phosphate-dependent aminotransferase [Deltaproteobacteria bacterium]|nr:pyridoxal phosphate-dependent aminotransferase [Deltaproteobacteria bacterium]MBW2304951.1 pyridoxal phosphate-dependent aminotransferase [Deltaproteobacteria bacterium]